MEDNKILYQDKKHKSVLVREKSDVPFSDDSSNVILDSYMRNNKEKYILQKEYVDFSADEITRYSILQSLLSKYSFVFAKENIISTEFSPTLLDNKIFDGVKDIEVEILPLDIHKIYPASFLESKKEIAIAHPQYIATNTKLERKMASESRDICVAINRLLQSELTVVGDQLGVKSIDLYPENMKVVKKTKGVLTFLITDIAADMKSFIKNKENTTLANKLLQEKGVKLQPYLKKLPHHSVRINTNNDSAHTKHSKIKDQTASNISKTISSED